MGKIVVRGEAARLRAVEIVRNGGSWDDAATETGFGRSYVRQLCTKAGVFTEKSRGEARRKRDGETKRLELLKWYKKGLKDKGIASKIGRSVTWVQKTRTDMGLPTQGSKKRLRKQKRKEELAQMEVRFCKKCGSFFYPKSTNQVYCSKACEKYTNHQINDIKRKRLEEKQKIDDIPLNAVFKKYNGICYLCGGKCDYSDVRYVNGIPKALGNYPSREHVIPLSKGGLHSWDNIRLAHIRCNSSKGVKYG